MSALRDALRGLPDAVFADVLESDDSYLLVVDLAGVTEDAVDAGVEGRRLRVDARREKDVPSAFTYRSEERSLFLDFDLPLPMDAAGRVEDVTVERGVLELLVPKRDAGGHEVPITVGDDGPTDVADARHGDAGDESDGAADGGADGAGSGDDGPATVDDGSTDGADESHGDEADDA